MEEQEVDPRTIPDGELDDEIPENELEAGDENDRYDTTD